MVSVVQVAEFVFDLCEGFIVKLDIFDEPIKEQLFDDEHYWEVGVFVSTLTVHY